MSAQNNQGVWARLDELTNMPSFDEVWAEAEAKKREENITIPETVTDGLENLTDSEFEKVVHEAFKKVEESTKREELEMLFKAADTIISSKIDDIPPPINAPKYDLGLTPVEPVAKFEPQFLFKKLSGKACAPLRATKYSAGYDLYSTDKYVVKPGKRILIKTGLAMAIPIGYYGRISPRSSLGLRGIDIGAGVIDSDYRGEVGVLFINNGEVNFEINPGERVAQLVLEKITTPPAIEVESLPDPQSNRCGGFGSTGI